MSRADAASFPPVIQSLEFDDFLPDPTVTLRDAVKVGRRGTLRTGPIFSLQNNVLFHGLVSPRHSPYFDRRQPGKHSLFMLNASATLSLYGVHGIGGEM
jgi:hypothetical protein